MAPILHKFSNRSASCERKFNSKCSNEQGSAYTGPTTSRLYSSIVPLERRTVKKRPIPCCLMFMTVQGQRLPYEALLNSAVAIYLIYPRRCGKAALRTDRAVTSDKAIKQGIN